MSTPEILRIVFGFIAVLAMIGASAYVARKAGLSNLSGPGSRKRRLAVTEMISIDARRRLAIIRCDDKEHLIVLGVNGETLIAGDMDCPAEAEGDTVSEMNPFAELTDFARSLRAARHRSPPKSNAA